MLFILTLIFLWLSRQGYGFSELLLWQLCVFGSALVCLFLFPKLTMNGRRSIFWGVMFSALQFLILIKIFNHSELYLSAIFSGLNNVFFWLPYNIMYFKFSHQERRGFHSGMYFLITPIIGVTLMPLAGVMAEKFGFETVFIAGVCAYSIPLLLVSLLPSFDYEINVKKYFYENKFNWTTFFQGMASRVNSSLIPIFTLFFITTPREFGNFFGYLALMTAVASVINGHISDRIKSRKIFFYLFTSLAVVSFLPLAFSGDSSSWHIFASIASLCFSLASPFWLTFNLDYYKNIGVEKTMALREMFLHLGYVSGLAVIFLVFYFTSSAKASLAVLSLACLFFPVVSYYQKVYLN